MKACLLIRLVFLTLVTLTILASQFSVGDGGFLDSYKRMRAIDWYKETVRLEKKRRLRELIDDVIKANAIKANATVSTDFDQQFDTISSFGMQQQEDQEYVEEMDEKEESILSKQKTSVKDFQHNRTMNAFDHLRNVFG